MRKFNIGNRIILSSDLELATNRYHYEKATRIQTVKSVTDDFFSPYEIDLNRSLAGSDQYMKCIQKDGMVWTYGDRKYFNLDLNPEEVLQKVESDFAFELTKDRKDSDKKISDLQEKISHITREIESLKQASKNEEELKRMKAYVLKGLKL